MNKILKSIGGVKLSKESQNQLFSKLADLLIIGFSLNQGLKFIGQIYPKLADATQQIMERLKSGVSFAQSCTDLVADEVVDQLSIAEQHGQLQATLEQLAQFNFQRIEQRKKIKALLVYPLVLMLILLILLVLIHSILLPQLSELNAGNEEVSKHHAGIWIVSGLLLNFSVLIWFLLKRLPVTRRYGILMKIPLIGKLVRQYTNYYLASNLAILLENGLTSKDILAVVQQFKPNSLLYELGGEIAGHLQNGDSYNVSLFHHSLIDSELISLLDGGETISEMARLMTAYAQLVFNNLIRDSNKLISLIQPTVFIVIGLVVTISYLQILMPIYQSIRGLY
ncbi:type II secretion system F family protein [Lentilactobacillus senioris]|uniref:type II secretion system F family protein n=1 Tax=Lentilactobacillus senioris TaxID=931534 RepID=UPI002281757F|nr:type II secretion system F family protein [Lentilactobacillus senioris]MCY9806724.1 type II secretion system F family protein [Lentilactobacillus senioris]